MRRKGNKKKVKIKMKQYINFLKSLYLNKPSPLSVSVNLTNKCNQHCIYCEVGQGLVKTEKTILILDDLKRIIDEMSRSGIPTLGLGGGVSRCCSKTSLRSFDMPMNLV